MFDILENKSLSHPSPLKGGSFSVQPFLPRELREGVHNSCTRYLQYPPHNDAHVCHCQKCNLSGQCSDRTRPSYTHFFHHSRYRQNSVKTDSMSKITMQYIITQFNSKLFWLCDATYSEKRCREHQRTFLSNIFLKLQNE